MLRSSLLSLSVALSFTIGCGPSTREAEAGATREASSSGEISSTSTCARVERATETVTARNTFGTLEGTLEVPEGCAGMPVVLILSGSGSQDRDGNSPRIYALLAEGLRDAGIAALRFDDPGVDASHTALPDKIEEFVYETEVDAMGAWLDVLASDRRFGPIVLAGHSQGSLTALLLAQRGSVDAVVSLAGTGRPIAEVLREQLVSRLTAEQLATFDATLEKVARGEIVDPVPPPLDRIMPPSVQPYFASWMKYDPKIEIAKLAQPVLIVQGGTDVQVSDVDAARLAEGNPEAQMLHIPDMCHVLREAHQKTASSQAAQYSEPAIPLHASLLPRLAQFVNGLEKP